MCICHTAAVRHQPWENGFPHRWEAAGCRVSQPGAPGCPGCHWTSCSSTAHPLSGTPPAPAWRRGWRRTAAASRWQSWCTVAQSCTHGGQSARVRSQSCGPDVWGRRNKKLAPVCAEVLKAKDIQKADGQEERFDAFLQTFVDDAVDFPHDPNKQLVVDCLKHPTQEWSECRRWPGVCLKNSWASPLGRSAALPWRGRPCCWRPAEHWAAWSHCLWWSGRSDGSDWRPVEICAPVGKTPKHEQNTQQQQLSAETKSHRGECLPRAARPRCGSAPTCWHHWSPGCVLCCLMAKNPPQKTTSWPLSVFTPGVFLTECYSFECMSRIIKGQFNPGYEDYSIVYPQPLKWKDVWHLATRIEP